MIRLRPAAERGYADHGWLQARHSFSFADYHDPAHMGWGALRVINEDIIAPDSGFGMHGHRNMEILTWLLSGELTHRDSLGHGGSLRPGEFQRMSAGKGILHSEFNASAEQPLHLLQIWIEPAQSGGSASYEQRLVEPVALDGRLHLIASPDGAGDSARIGQDAQVFVSRLAAGEQLGYTLAPARLGWLQVARGKVVLNGQALAAGDGAGLVDETALAIAAEADSEFLLFDLPPADR